MSQRKELTPSCTVLHVICKSVFNVGGWNWTPTLIPDTKLLARGVQVQTDGYMADLFSVPLLPFTAFEYLIAIIKLKLLFIKLLLNV